jgi:ELWxxDGT repeat protein
MKRRQCAQTPRLETIERRLLLAAAATMSSLPQHLVDAGDGILFFIANDGVHGRELWKSDGTAAGTALVRDINPAGDAFQIAQYIEPWLTPTSHGSIYFAADDGEHGRELWKSDGTAAGTQRLADIAPGSGTSNPSELKIIGDTLFFAATDTPAVLVTNDPEQPSGYYTGNYELWKSDGTAAGTVRVKEINPGDAGSNPLSLTDVNGTFFFAATDASHGGELWKSDGTEAGTVLVRDILVGADSSYPFELLNVDGTLFFSAADARASDDAGGLAGLGNTELWKSDGTEAGTVLVKEINTRVESLVRFGSHPSELTNVGGTVFFNADDGVHGEELWKSDGTAVGTVLVKDIESGSSGASPSELVNLNGTLYFLPVITGALWKSDGTESGTVQVAAAGGISTQELTKVGDTLYFTSGNFAPGRGSLWKSDGTTAGTVEVAQFEGDPDLGASVGELANVSGKLFFRAADAAHGSELWTSDGTAAGTALVADINTTGTDNPVFWNLQDDGTLGTERDRRGRFLRRLSPPTRARIPETSRWSSAAVRIRPRRHRRGRGAHPDRLRRGR